MSVDAKTKKIFISVPMRGRTDEQILSSIGNCTNVYSTIVGGIYPDLNITFLHNFKTDGTLGEAIDLLKSCDACVFAYDYEEAKGCMVESFVCDMYDIPKFIACLDCGHYVLERIFS